MKLKVYTTRDWLLAGKVHTIMLYPFWGDIPLADQDPDKGRFDEWIKEGKNILQLCDTMQESDVFLLPYEFSFEKEYLDHTQALSRLAHDKGKKLLIFYNNDNADPIPVNNAIIFRTSLYASHKLPGVYAWPGWSVDFRKEYGQDRKLHEVQPVPDISYCGYVDYLKFSGYLKEAGWKKAWRGVFNTVTANEDGTRLRGKAVRALLKAKGVKTHFLIRNGFWAGGVSDKKEARRSYAENMFSATYVLVVRGAGNFSYRLYEALSCGCIPVIINTDCMLPFEEFIAWDKQCLRVDYKEVDRIEEYLTAFHTKLGKDGVLTLQEQSRKLYEEWISPSGFFSNIYRYIH